MTKPNDEICDYLGRAAILSSQTFPQPLARQSAHYTLLIHCVVVHPCHICLTGNFLSALKHVRPRQCISVSEILRRSISPFHWCRMIVYADRQTIQICTCTSEHDHDFHTSMLYMYNFYMYLRANCKLSMKKINEKYRDFYTPYMYELEGGSMRSCVISSMSSRNRGRD